MGKRDLLVLGLWNALCDRCGFKYKNNELRETWDHLRVCEPCYETRHPQDFVRGVADNQDVPWSRPDRDLDANRQPVLDVGPTFNCTTCEPMWFNSVFSGDTIITKGLVRSPMIVTAGTITVRCSLEIR